MRFTTNLKKKTSKKFKDDSKINERLNKYDDGHSKKLTINISFEDCKYAKFVPSDLDIKLEDKCDLLGLHNNSNDKKLDRLNHLQIIAKYIFTSAYCSRSISTWGIINLNKRVKHVTKKYRTDKSDTEAMQMLFICKEFQRVIKRTVNDPSIKKKIKSKEYDDNLNSIKNISKDDIPHKECFEDGVEQRRKRLSNTESNILLGKDYESCKFYDDEIIDSECGNSNGNAFKDLVIGNSECAADSREQMNQRIKMNSPSVTTEICNLEFGKEDDPLTTTYSAGDRQYEMFYSQTTRPKQRYMHENFYQTEKGGQTYTKAKLFGEHESKRCKTKLIDDTGSISDEPNYCSCSNPDINYEYNTRPHGPREVAKMDDGDVKILFKQDRYSREAGIDNQSLQKCSAEKHSLATAIITDKHHGETELTRRQKRLYVKTVPKYSCKDFCTMNPKEIRNQRRFGQINEEHCKSVFHLVTHRLNNDSSIYSVCVFIQENTNEFEDLVDMRFEFINKCLSAYFYPGKNIVSINIQRDLKKFLQRTVFQNSSLIKDLFGEIHLRSDAKNIKAVVMVSQPISSLLRHKDICLLDTLQVILGIDRGMLLLLEALGKS